MKELSNKPLAAALTIFVITWLAAPAYAVDGVVLIDQNKALAGNVTPGDLPGFPVTIGVSGSYRLTGNLTGNGTVQMVTITADDVTLDLNGFAIRGPMTCSRGFGTGGRYVRVCVPTVSVADAQHGVVGAGRSVVVQNGTVRGMTGVGVFLNGLGSVARDVNASSNGYAGILVSRGSAIRITADYNRIGIEASLIVDSYASENEIAFHPVGLLARSTDGTSFHASLTCTQGGYSSNVLAVSLNPIPQNLTCRNLGQNLCPEGLCP